MLMAATPSLRNASGQAPAREEQLFQPLDEQAAA